MKRREFLEAGAAAALLGGCGGGGGSSAAEPDTLHVSRTDVHAADRNGVVYRATPTANVVSRLDGMFNNFRYLVTVRRLTGKPVA